MGEKALMYYQFKWREGGGLLGMDTSNRVATYVIKHGIIKMGVYKPLCTKCGQAIKKSIWGDQ